MEYDDAGSIPRPKTFLYMPFPYTQRMKAPLQCDGELLLFELSASMFSSWATSFSQCVQIRDHMLILSLFTTLIQHCIDNKLHFVLETVVDEVDFWGINRGILSNCVQPKSYRLWIPLTHIGTMIFCKTMENKFEANTDPNVDENSDAPRKKSRSSIDKNKLPHCCLIKSKETLMAALRLYFGARRTINDIVFSENNHDEDNPSDAKDSDHILTLLSATTYFQDSAVADKHCQQRLNSCQSDLMAYTKNVTVNDDHNPVVSCFMPKEKIITAQLCRLINTGPGCIFQSGMDLFKYLLPHFLPPRRLVLNKIRTVLDSIGETFDPKYNDMSL